MRAEEQQAIEPWYRQFWPWFIFSLPAAVVIACMVTIYIAVTHPDSPVKDDYYRDGLTINRDLAAQQAALAYDVQALLRANSLTTDVSVTLQGDFPVAPEKLTLQFIHPNDAKSDIVVLLYSAGKQVYIGELPTVNNGRWHLQLRPVATNDWLLKKTVQIDNELTIELSGQ